MKKVTIILGIITAIVVVSSCTQKTCPTYSDNKKIDEHSEEMFI